MKEQRCFNSLVTGGLRGIGRAIVNQLASRGDTVFVFDIMPSTESSVAQLVSKNIMYIQVDVSCPQSIKSGFETIYHKVSSLDLLVNNAGITRDNLAIRLPENDWDSVLDVNLKGSFFCAQQALRRMIKNKKSYIINISSIVGLRGNSGQANYAASKAGMLAVTKSLAREYGGRNVLVNALAPGFIQTDMTDALPENIKEKALDHIPLKRFGLPSDIANMVAFLSSGKADYVTGQVIEVTGGM